MTTQTFALVITAGALWLGLMGLLAAAPFGAGPRARAALGRLEARRRRPARREARGRPWAWKIATIAGVDLYVHGTFWLLLGLLAVGDLSAGRDPSATARGALLLLAVFATIVLHEFGHALMGRRFGALTRDITLWPIGGIARMARLPERPGQQLLVALAGPAVNAAIAALLFGLAYLRGSPVRLDSAFGAGGPFLTQLLWINLSLAAFNLLPAYPLDGGRVLRALLAMRLAPERATQVAARVGQFAALLLGAAGLFGNPLLVVVAAFVWFGARADLAASQTKVALLGLAVRHAMVTDFRTLAPADPLSRAVDLSLAGFQHDFPVVEGARPVGVLTRDGIFRALAARGTGSSVGEAMQTRFETASPWEPLDGALTRLNQGEHHFWMVTEDAKVIGLLTPPIVGELLALEAAIRRTDRPSEAPGPRPFEAAEAS